MKRVRWIAWIMGLALLLLTLHPVLAAEEDPIRIGFLVPLTGVFAQNGQDMRDGFEMYLEENGRTLGGRPVEVLYEDSEGNPETGLTKARKLVERDGVDFVMGPLSSAVAYAVAEYVQTAHIPHVAHIASADDLTQRRLNPYFFRIGFSTGSQPMHAFGDWVYRELGYRRVVTIAYDFAFGWENVGGFQRAFEDAGGKVIQKIWTPTGTPDFLPYLAQIDPSADAVLAVYSGADAVRFLQQYEQFGMKDQFPLLGGGSIADMHVLRSVGREAEGMISALHYSPALETEINRRFVEKYEERFGRLPGAYVEDSYSAAVYLDEAIASIDGNVENKEAFIDALKTTSVAETPRGPVRIDEYQNVVHNIYILRTDWIDGRIVPTVIDTIPEVSQFWRYDPEEYLAQPPYARDYPPVTAD